MGRGQPCLAAEEARPRWKFRLSRPRSISPNNIRRLKCGGARYDAEVAVARPRPGMRLLLQRPDWRPRHCAKRPRENTYVGYLLLSSYRHHRGSLRRRGRRLVISASQDARVVGGTSVTWGLVCSASGSRSLNQHPPAKSIVTRQQGRHGNQLFSRHGARGVLSTRSQQEGQKEVDA